MKKTLIVLAAALIATPVLAQSAGNTAAPSKPQAKKSSKPISEAQPRSGYSTNPEYDVYFRGEYVGSDPDPRVRWTLRDEARRSYGLND